MVFWRVVTRSSVDRAPMIAVPMDDCDRANAAASVSRTSRCGAHQSGTQIRYAEFDRWAAPLPTLFGRALGQDLSALLGARVVPHPWYRATPLDVIVRVDVTAFETEPPATPGWMRAGPSCPRRPRRCAAKGAGRSSRRSASAARRRTSPRSAALSASLPNQWRARSARAREVARSKDEEPQRGDLEAAGGAENRTANSRVSVGEVR